jgi:hypothetical protein
VAITLTASDVDGDSLTYSVVTTPVSGSLSGSAPNLTYTPNNNFNGQDSFTFTVNDGTVDSNEATVSITVNAVNAPNNQMRCSLWKVSIKWSGRTTGMSSRYARFLRPLQEQ